MLLGDLRTQAVAGILKAQLLPERRYLHREERKAH
jgi:hypothetical protein